MTHKNKPSSDASLRHALRSWSYKFIHKTSYHDPILCETVCLVVRDTIQANVPVEYATIVTQVPNVEKGLILSDSRGRGAFQK